MPRCISRLGLYTEQLDVSRVELINRIDSVYELEVANYKLTHTIINAYENSCEAKQRLLIVVCLGGTR